LDNLRQSDKEWANYWDELMSKSDSPVPWGTIVQEKPTHQDKTIDEEKKLHRFKKTKKRRFKIK
jgi:hypothetical protein